MCTINANGQGPCCDPVTAIPCCLPDAPEPPSLFHADSEVVLSWTAPNSQGNTLIGYVVYQSLDNITYGVIADTTLLTFTALHLVNGNVVYFKVSAKNSIDHLATLEVLISYHLMDN